MTLLSRVWTFLQTWEAVAQPTVAYSLVVGVSGGPDSLALLHVLSQLYPPHRLTAVHVDHHIRPESAAEATFVHETAVSWGLACQVISVDVPALARSHGWTLEEAGRQARYQAFAAAAGQTNAAAVVVAHHADDQAETVLLHLLRGTGLTGLRGMLPITPLPNNPTVPLLRPFLTLSRSHILTYCQSQQLHPRHDATNDDLTYFRNRVRHDLLPRLRQYNPQMPRQLTQLAAIVAADEAVLVDQTARLWAQLCATQATTYLALHRELFNAAPLALRRRVLRWALTALRPSLRDVSFMAIDQACQLAEIGRTGAQATLPGNLTLTVDYHLLTLTTDPQFLPTHLPQLPTATPIPLPVPGTVALAPGWRLTAVWSPEIPLTVMQQNRDPWQAFVRVSATTPLVIRPRQLGERFQPLGMGGKSVSVQDVMINRKIPARLRALWPVVAAPEHLIWLVGHHLDDRIRVTTESPPILWLRCVPEEAVTYTEYG